STRSRAASPITSSAITTACSRSTARWAIKRLTIPARIWRPPRRRWRRASPRRRRRCAPPGPRCCATASPRMPEGAPDFTIARLGECRIPSPMAGVRFVADDDRVLYASTLKDLEASLGAAAPPPAMEMAGPRGRIFFDPARLGCGIVTCGGLCPGLNDVIRAIVLSLHHHYGVRRIYGFRYGYEGLVARHG